MTEKANGRVQFYVTPEQLNQIDRCATGLRMTRSEIIRYALKRTLEYHQCEFPEFEIKSGRPKTKGGGVTK